MSWVDKELRRREKVSSKRRGANSTEPADTTAETAAGKIAALWEQIERRNTDLPVELRLTRQTASDNKHSAERLMFLVILIANNGSFVGFTGDGIRYSWPQTNRKKSNNFWIWWKPQKGYRLSRRIVPSWGDASSDESAFNEASIDYIFKCLVTDTRAKYRSLRKRRFWLF